MIYIQRNDDGTIISIALQADAQHSEAMEKNHPDLHTFFAQTSDAALDEIQSSDTEFIRVLEDVIDLLIDRDLLQFTELPAPAQQKLLSRRQIRERLESKLSTSSTLLMETPQHEDLI